MKIQKIVANDLIQVLQEDRDPETIAEIITALFEFTKNDQFKLWQVSEILCRIANDPEAKF